MQIEKPAHYCPELDALRFWAFLQVFVHHFWSMTTWRNRSEFGTTEHFLERMFAGGGFGVDLFFCLSSFLITTILLREWYTKGSFDIRRFWMRRILRIWPLYYSFLIFVTVVLVVFGTNDRWHLKSFVLFAFFAGNAGSMSFGWPSMHIAPLWSVSLEEQFYLIWPLLLLWLTPSRIETIAWIGLAVGIVSRIIFLQFGQGDPDHKPYLWVIMPTRLDPFMTGALFAVFVRKYEWAPTTKIRLALATIGIVTPIALCLSGPRIEVIESTSMAVWSYSAVAISSVCMLGAVYRQNIVPVPAIIAYFGRISYGAYVFHMSVMMVMFKFVPVSSILYRDPTSNPLVIVAWFFATLVPILVISHFSYKFLESRFLRLKEKKYGST